MATRKTGRTGADDEATSETEGTLPGTDENAGAKAVDGDMSEADSPAPDSGMPEAREADEPVSEADAPEADLPAPESGMPEARQADEPMSEADAPASERMEAGIDPDRAQAGAPETNEPDPVVAPRETAATTHDGPEDYAEDEGGSSLAAKALTFLVLLLAGAALGIWAAPKIAPSLPSGMAPVAAWLAPGQNMSDARIAELEARLETELSDVDAQIAAFVVPEDVDVEAVVTAVRSETEARIADLEAALTEVRETVSGLDDAETRQRIARIETALEGQVAEFEGLKSQLTDGGTTEVGAMSAEQIDLYQSEVAGLRAEMGAVSDSVSVLSSRIDEVAATADRSIEAAQLKVEEVQAEAQTVMEEAQTAMEEAQASAAVQVEAAETEAEAAAIRSALAAGQPFAEPVARLSDNPDIAVPDGLAAAAETGAPTVSMLRDSFPDAAHSAIRASIQATADDGVLARSRAFLEAQVATRSLTPQPGLDPDAVLSRMEDHLRRGDLAAALSEAESLPSEARDAMSDWLADARRRLDAETGMEALRSSLPTSN